MGGLEGRVAGVGSWRLGSENTFNIQQSSLLSPHDLLLGDIGPVDVASFKVEVHGDRSLHFFVVDEQGVALGQQAVTAQVFAVRKQQLRLVL